MRAIRNRVRPSLETLEDRAVPATFLVKNLNDAGADSLRQAILDANNQPGADVIAFDAGVTGAIDLQGALPNLSSDIDLEGPGANLLTVQRGGGAANFRIFTVAGNATVTLAGLTVANGYDASDSGGGISNLGNLTVSRSTVKGNFGGGIYNDGTLTVRDSTVSGNTAFYAGGGIFNEDSGHSVTVVNSTISGNTSQLGGGGGLDNDIGSTMTVINCTVTGNTSQRLPGGGIDDNGGEVIIHGSIVAGNSAPSGPDVYGFFTSQGYNLVGNDSGSTINRNLGDLVGTAGAPIDPKLGPLQDNGGPTFTHALLSGSPAIDAGTGSGTDQRGVDRGQDGDGNGSDRADMGAFEVRDTKPPVVTSIVRAQANPTDSNNVSWTVTFSEAVSGVDRGDFTLAQSGGVSGAAVTRVTGSGRVWHVAASTGLGDGSLRLRLNDDDSIRDAAGNALAGNGAGNGSFSGPAYTLNRLHDVTGRVRVSLVAAGDPLRFRRATVRNVSADPILGPLVLVLDGLTPGVALRYRTGLTRTGSPFVRLSAGLGAGRQLAQLLDFVNPHHAAIRFRLRVLAGLGSP